MDLIKVDQWILLKDIFIFMEHMKRGLIGQKASHGCIRMFNHDVIELYDLVSEDTLVNIL